MAVQLSLDTVPENTQPAIVRFSNLFISLANEVLKMDERVDAGIEPSTRTLEPILHETVDHMGLMVDPLTVAAWLLHRLNYTLIQTYTSHTNMARLLNQPEQVEFYMRQEDHVLTVLLQSYTMLIGEWLTRVQFNPNIVEVPND